MSPAPAPGGPKQMPKWAWPVAIGVGLLIGFLLLRKTPEEYEEEQQEESPYPEGQRRGGGGGAMPFDDKLLEAFGLTPPTQEFQGSGTGDGFDSGGETVTFDGQAIDNASSQPYVTGSFQEAGSLAGIPGASSSVFEGYGTTPTAESKTTGPGYSPGAFNTSEPTSEGSGNRSNLAQ